MYILLILCVVAPLLQNGFALNGEETDLNSLSSYEAIDDNDENFEIWNSDDAGMIVFDSISTALLEKVCRENSNVLVYITQEDSTIDCKVYIQPIDETKNIVKREAEDNIFEGSGEPPEENVAGATLEKSEDGQEATPPPEEPSTDNLPQENVEIPARFDEENTEQNGTEVEINKETETTPNPEVDVATTEVTSTSEITSPKPASTENSVLDVDHEVKTDTPKTEESTQSSLSDNMENEEKTDPPQTEVPTQTNSIDREETLTPEPQTPPATDPETPQEVNDKEQPEDYQNSDKTTTNPKNDAGMVKGRTLLDPKTHEETGEELVKADDPKEGESTSKAGSKDTTILIVLFVAVVVVGALAFGYNYIKKRKQRSADLEAVERGPIKRSLQNLANGGDEPEKKPLMGNNKEVEMVDMKKESSVPELEKVSNESTVKS